jgi:NO-binding membrane sensor protein with MHYT domain
MISPQQLFPLLAVFFLAMALLSRIRRRTWRRGALTWIWLGLCFAGVSIWLHWH